MVSSATLRNIRISPRKVRLVADLVRGKSVTDVTNILTHLPKGSAAPLLTLLKSAIANAKAHNHEDLEALRISAITVDMAPRLKRFMPHAMGRATTILKHASHITLTLDILVKKAKPAKKIAGKPKAEKAVEKKADTPTPKKA